MKAGGVLTKLIASILPTLGFAKYGMLRLEVAKDGLVGFRTLQNISWLQGCFIC